MSPIHRPGFEPAAAPEFTLSPFVIPTPSRDETRIRNLQTQVPGRLAASTGDLHRPGFEPAAAPEFTLSPFVIPTPSRDETRIRNLQTQVPGRLAASTGD